MSKTTKKKTVEKKEEKKVKLEDSDEENSDSDEEVDIELKSKSKQNIKHEDDEEGVIWEPVNKESELKDFLGIFYRSGLWRRISQSEKYKEAKEVHIVNMDHGDVDGDDKGYLKYKDGRELLVYEGKFSEGIPIGTHIQYLPDKKEKYTKWICKKHFDLNKTAILLSYDTNIKGKEKIGLKCKNPNPFPENETSLKVQIKKGRKTKQPLQKECKKLGISYREKDTISILEEKIRQFVKTNVKNED